jgi:archaeal flagellar protein FlaF
METAITALIVIGVMVLSIVSLSDRSLTAQAVISDSTRLMQERAGERMRTSLTPLSVATTAQGDVVQLTFRNSGSTKLADFDKWDVILQYSDGLNPQVKWYPYGSDVNQWTQQIYQVASTLSAEGVEPGILNPGEEVVISVSVSPAIGTGTTNMVTINTPNGVRASTVFTR